MKIKAKLFSKFLRKSMISDENVLLTFDNGLETKVVNKGQQILAETKLNKDSFTEYQDGQESVGIKNLTLFKKFVERFDSEINFTIKNNILEMKDGTKKVIMSLADKDYIKVSDYKCDSLIYEKPQITLETNFLKSMIKDAEVYGNPKIIFQSKNGDFIITIKESGMSDRIVMRQTIPTLKGHDFITIYQTEYLKLVIDCLTEEKINLNLDQEKPLKITEIGKEIKAIYIVCGLDMDNPEEELK